MPSLTSTRIPTDAVTLTVDDLNTRKGNLKARKALAAGRPLVITVEGKDAFTLGKSLPGAGANANIVGGGVGEVVLGVAFFATVVALMGLAVVAVICMYGMSLGYRVKAVHNINNKELIFDDTVTFILVPPGADD